MENGLNGRNGLKRIFYSACGGKTRRRRVKVRFNPFRPFSILSFLAKKGEAPKSTKCINTSLLCRFCIIFGLGILQALPP